VSRASAGASRRRAHVARGRSSDTPARVEATAADAPVAWWRQIPHPFDAYLASRVLMIVACALGRGLIPHPTFVGAMPLRPAAAEPFIALPSIPALDGWARWDSAWYRAIALEGYGVSLGDQTAVAFFPLFPIIAGLVALPLRLLLSADEAFYLAGFLVSNAAFLAVVVLLHRLARALLPARTAGRAIWLFCLYPFSFFYSAVYTESLFVALSLGALLLARDGRWRWACLAACFAGITRNVGVLLLPAIAIEYLRQNGWQWRALLRRDALAFLVGPLGLAGYAAFLWVKLGDPLAFLRAQDAWGHELALPPVRQLVAAVLSVGVPWRYRLDSLWCLGIVATFPIFAVVSWRRFGPSIGCFAVALTAAPMLGGLSDGLGRYSSVVFPAFLLIGQGVRRRSSFIALCALWAALAVVFISGFSHWDWPY
jgi:hypothetical protein